jgi:enediyne biosynthesis thioesterase
VRYFETRFAVSFSDTNVVGNVYFANYFLWQGKCREEFLRQYAPQILQDFRAGYGMITKESACVFHHETFAFEEILIRMRLERLTRTAIAMQFDYYRVEAGPLRTLVAEGRQTAMWVNPEHKIAMLPQYLRVAVLQFAGDSVSAVEEGDSASMTASIR